MVIVLFGCLKDKVYICICVSLYFILFFKKFFNFKILFNLKKKLYNFSKRLYIHLISMHVLIFKVIYFIHNVLLFLKITLISLI
jgi:hypothetical protein